MKRFVLFASAIFFAYAVCKAVFPHSDPLRADPTGCCMQRADPQIRNWYRNGLNFAACDQLNRELDNDDIFQESGRIWWNLRPDCSLPP
jgi:hypothetical protein